MANDEAGGPSRVDGGRCRGDFLQLPCAAAVARVPVRVEGQGQVMALDAVIGKLLQKLVTVLRPAGVHLDRTLAHDQERVRKAEPDLNDGGHGSSQWPGTTHTLATGHLFLFDGLHVIRGVAGDVSRQCSHPDRLDFRMAAPTLRMTSEPATSIGAEGEQEAATAPQNARRQGRLIWSR